MRLACAIVFLVACGAPDDPGGGVSVEADALDGAPAAAHVLWQRGTTSTAATTASSLLVDHGGRVLPSSSTYAIWWGSASAFPSDARTGLDALFADLAGTSFLGIADQYMRGASITSAFRANYSDGSAPPNHSPSVATIVNEACKTIHNNGLTADPSAIYFVYTSNFPHGGNFCAWHSDGACDGVTIQVAYMPNTAGVGGCNPLGVENLGCNTDSEGTISLANVTSHEFMEAITDADINAWFDSSGSEIGDKCAWQFSSCVGLNGSSWQLQEEWSNASGGCVQQ